MDSQWGSEQQLKVQLDRLPMLPAVVARLAALDRDSDDYFERVYELLEEDPPFAVRMLGVANSAISAPVSPITTLRGAIARLGTNLVTNMVTSAALCRVFVPNTPQQKNLWIHSVQTATAARMIALRSGDFQVDPETAYLAGLLHDIGRFVIFQAAPDDEVSIDESGFPPNMIAEEQERWGSDHAELGWRVCHSWNLPEDIAVIIRDHHAANLIRRDDLTAVRMHEIMVVQMADAVSMLLMFGEPFADFSQREKEDAVQAACFQSTWPRTPVSPGELLAMLPAIEDEAEELLTGLFLS